ncbi:MULTISPECIES: hypothetical protein [Brevibacillus]|uniref:hypothetical protein n=1 Tax=Brevibacillus TaxID=55080 RepID=UPI00203F58A6|nr:MULTISPECIES: hypothetical protein [Brevibacillus]MCM3080431.1 hypothetical protein [Brevibacillus invocatus]MCM3430647.1 hypothetical protein [Brevibacillus invocatus]MDH4616973.1 hypothetical protein [Brevibacillus sp. AY1]
MYKNWFSVGGLLIGLIGSLMSLIVCYDYIFGESFKGLDFLLFLLIMLPAICALVTSFVAAPIILVPFIWSLPFSTYLFIASDVKWFAISCVTYLISAYLKFQGTKDHIHLSN